MLVEGTPERTARFKCKSCRLAKSDPTLEAPGCRLRSCANSAADAEGEPPYQSPIVDKFLNVSGPFVQGFAFFIRVVLAHKSIGSRSPFIRNNRTCRPRLGRTTGAMCAAAEGVEKGRISLTQPRPMDCRGTLPWGTGSCQDFLNAHRSNAILEAEAI